MSLKFGILPVLPTEDAKIVLVLTSIQDLSEVFIFMLAGLKYKQKVPKPAEFDNLTVVGNKEAPKAEL
jgi:hypothetical protein